MQVRPVGQTMRVLVRIPLESVRDVDFPALAGGYLNVAALSPQLAGLAKIWVADAVTLYENGQALSPAKVTATQISLESDTSFATYDRARAHFDEPLPTNEQSLFWKQVFFDVALEYPIRDPQGPFEIRPAFASLGERVNTVLHFGERAFLLPGDQEAFPLAPTWWQAAALFVRLGFFHILSGLDHLLFLLCLVLSSRQFRALIWVATAFTAAHSLTLAASALGWAPDGLWFPPFVELSIALSIVFLALANLAGHSHARIGLAFGFGLVHGFGYSFALRESLQFAGSHLVPALFAFNVGVELGQLAALAVMVPAVALLFRYWVAERIGVIILSALIAHTAWHWMEDRFGQLSKFPLPDFTLAMALRGVMVIMLLWAIYWGAQRFRTR